MYSPMMSFLIKFKASFCLLLRSCGFKISNCSEPGEYFIRPFCSALLRLSSLSALAGTIMVSLYRSCSLAKFLSAPSMSILFASYLRKVSKPTLIVANKIDIEGADKNFARLHERYNDTIIVPASADSELSLRRAEQKGLIKYSPGSEQFDILNPQDLNNKQKDALNFIKKDIMGEYMRTGVQFAINVTVFKLLKMNSIYPVANEEKLSDKKGRILPDLILMKDGSTVTDLAKEIHTDLLKGLLYAKDLRYNLRLPTNYQLRDRDVISLVSASKKKT